MASEISTEQQLPAVNKANLSASILPVQYLTPSVDSVVSTYWMDGERYHRAVVIICMRQYREGTTWTALHINTYTCDFEQQTKHLLCHKAQK